MGQENWANYGDSLKGKKSTTSIELCKVSKISKIDNENIHTGIQTGSKGEPTAETQSHTLPSTPAAGELPGVLLSFPSSRNGFPH